jgi:hypothetical protein
MRALTPVEIAAGIKPFVERPDAFEYGLVGEQIGGRRIFFVLQVSLLRKRADLLVELGRRQGAASPADHLHSTTKHRDLRLPQQRRYTGIEPIFPRLAVGIGECEHGPSRDRRTAIACRVRTRFRTANQ